jgi:hypothetical protein
MIREGLYRVSFLEKNILPMRRSVLNGPLGPWSLGPGPGRPGYLRFHKSRGTPQEGLELLQQRSL